MQNIFNFKGKIVMKFFIFVVVFSLFIGLFAFGAEVKMKSLSFDPKLIEITQGDSVTWKNTAYTEHSATSDDTKAAFDTGLIVPGKESTITFKNAGEFKYHCSVHGKSMNGTVVVKAAAQK
jgi:plastocyanin